MNCYFPSTLWRSWTSSWSSRIASTSPSRSIPWRKSARSRNWPTRSWRWLGADRGSGSSERRRHRPERAVQAVAIDGDAFHDALDVVAGLAERDHFDPVDHVNLAGARIADGFQPAGHPAGAGIVGGQRQLVGAAEALQHLRQVLAAKLHVVAGLARQLV